MDGWMNQIPCCLLRRLPLYPAPPPQADLELEAPAWPAVGLCCCLLHAVSPDPFKPPTRPASRPGPGDAALARHQPPRQGPRAPHAQCAAAGGRCWGALRPSRRWGRRLEGRWSAEGRRNGQMQRLPPHTTATALGGSTLPLPCCPPACSTLPLPCRHACTALPLQRDPAKRLTAAEVLGHPWLNEEAPDRPLEQVAARLAALHRRNQVQRAAMVSWTRPFGAWPMHPQGAPALLGLLWPGTRGDGGRWGCGAGVQSLRRAEHRAAHPLLPSCALTYPAPSAP